MTNVMTIERCPHRPRSGLQGNGFFQSSGGLLRLRQRFVEHRGAFDVQPRREHRVAYVLADLRRISFRHSFEMLRQLIREILGLSFLEFQA